MELIVGVLPFIVVLGVFWLFLIRPQQKQQKAHREMLDALQSGDDIITIGGIKGKIIKIKDNNVKLRIAPNVDINVVKNSIGNVEEANKSEDNEKS
ncbi:preprotein translocase subunit YajC [Natronospora cellulosivora (SeqCode)]